MSLNHLQLRKGILSDQIFIGIRSPDNKRWESKRDITDDFLKTALSRWSGRAETITDETGETYIISVLSESSTRASLTGCHPYITALILFGATFVTGWFLTFSSPAQALMIASSIAFLVTCIAGFAQWYDEL